MTKYYLNAFAKSGDKTAVPDNDAGDNVSYDAGYTPAYQLPKTDPSRKNIDRSPMNQLFNDITENIKHWQEKVYPEFITASANGGAAFPYKNEAIVSYLDVDYISLVGANVDLPTSSNWELLSFYYDRKAIARFLNTDEENIGLGEVGRLVTSTLYAADQQVIYNVPAGAIGKIIDNINIDQLTTTDASVYTLIVAQSSISESTNRFKGNQNPVIAGATGDPLVGSTPTTYLIGSQPAAEYEIITTNAEQLTYITGVWNSGNNTGIIRRRYAQDGAVDITKSSQYGGVKLSDGTQLQAQIDDIVTNGVRITEDLGDVCVDVDLSVLTAGFKFIGLSDERGIWPDINDDESFIEQTGALSFDFSENGYHIFPSGMVIQWGFKNVSPDVDTIISFPIAFPSTCASMQIESDYSIGSGILNVTNIAVNKNNVNATVRYTGNGTVLYYTAIGY